MVPSVLPLAAMGWTGLSNGATGAAALALSGSTACDTIVMWSYTILFLLENRELSFTGPGPGQQRWWASENQARARRCRTPASRSGQGWHRCPAGLAAPAGAPAGRQASHGAGRSLGAGTPGGPGCAACLRFIIKQVSRTNMATFFRAECKTTWMEVGGVGLPWEGGRHARVAPKAGLTILLHVYGRLAI